MRVIRGGVFALLLAGMVFSISCNSMNRTQFSRLEAMKIEGDSCYYRYLASTGSVLITCSPKKMCQITGKRPPIWPLDNAQAEKQRLQWLGDWLAENGYANAKYEILSRQVIAEDDYTLSQGGLYELCYDVRVILAETAEPTYAAAVEEVD
ncbi:MAG: hypothetical protein ACYSWP_04600 [Planctomycetota bacterium]